MCCTKVNQKQILKQPALPIPLNVLHDYCSRRSGKEGDAVGLVKNAGLTADQFGLETSLGPFHRRLVYPWGIFPPQFPYLRSKLSSNAVIPTNQLQIPVLSYLHFTHWEHCYFLLVSEIPHFTWLSSSLSSPLRAGFFDWLLAYLILEVEVLQWLVLVIYCFHTYISSLGALTQTHDSKYCLDADG